MRTFAIALAGLALGLAACTPSTPPEPSETTSTSSGAATTTSTSLYDVQEGGPDDVLVSGGFDSLAGGELLLTSIDDGPETRSVTFTFEGAGPLEWRAQYFDVAIQDGSGLELDMGEGNDGILQVLLRGMRYPEPNEEVLQGADIAGMTVKVDPPFEGQSSLFLAIPARENFRIEVTAPEDVQLLTVTFLGD